MPDALARGMLTGASAIIRSLALIATKGAAAVKALGMYLIGPKTQSAGPLVLHAPYSKNHVLRNMRTSKHCSMNWNGRENSRSGP